ncbi:MAG: winged helix-turn-helix transcriptional regulator [Nanoarchaeota archaeon]
MDTLDRKILFELDKDSRVSCSQIARSIRTSKETVRYRINSLVEKGVIQKFLTILNTTKLGNSYYQIMLKLQNANERDKSMIISFLKTHRNIAWIGDLEGNYDIAFIIYVTDQIQLQSLIEDLHGRFSKYIMKKVLSVNLHADFFARDYLVGNERSTVRRTSYKSHKGSTILDDADEKICASLGEDSRRSSVEIAKRIGLSSDAVLKRIVRLRNKGIILGSTLVLDQTVLHQSHYKILVSLNNLSKDKESRLIESSSLNNRVIAIVRVLAQWDYEIDIEVEDISQLRSFIIGLTTRFSDIIRDYEVLRIVSMPKYTFYP